MDLADDPFPERQGLGVGVVDPEHADAVLDPVEQDIAPGLEQLLDVGAVPVDRVDVLVLLRWVLGVPDGPVDAAVGELGGPVHPGGVGRALGGGGPLPSAGTSRTTRRYGPAGGRR